MAVVPDGFPTVSVKIVAAEPVMLHHNAKTTIADTVKTKADLLIDPPLILTVPVIKNALRLHEDL